MGGLQTGASGGRWRRGGELAGVAALLALGAPCGLAAQVGFEPSQSPYRDIRGGGAWLVTGGYFGGSRGGVGVGISDGATGGLRYEAPFGAIGMSLGIAYAQTTRFVVDPTKDSLSRKTGPFDTDVVLADAGLQLVLTGRKTWRGLAPYLGASAGIAIGGGSPPDPSGYQFRNKFTFGPDLGVRWYPARRLSVRLDFRAVAWKLSYPLSYKVPNLTDGSRVLAVTAPLDEWVWHRWSTIGLGWTF